MEVTNNFVNISFCKRWCVEI